MASGKNAQDDKVLVLVLVPVIFLVSSVAYASYMNTCPVQDWNMLTGRTGRYIPAVRVRHSSKAKPRFELRR